MNSGNRVEVSANDERPAWEGRPECVEHRGGLPLASERARKDRAAKKRTASVEVERALATLRPLTRARLIVVFGAGGDRDKGKRPTMGAIAARAADLAIITSDNPRTEDPERILDDIEAGMGDVPHLRIEGRRAVIVRALSIAAPGDTVLLAGKGHEDYQVLGTEKLPFDERAIVTGVLAEKGA